MKTGKQYLASFQDVRRVYRRGARVEDVTPEPGLREPVAESADGYNRDARPEAGSSHPMFDVPRSLAGAGALGPGTWKPRFFGLPLESPAGRA